MNRPQEVTILLVEDDPGHARLIEKNLRRANISNEIVNVTNGQQALDYLFAKGSFSHIDTSKPLLLLLDLNLPVLDGYQVLQTLKTDERTKHIPVIILTTTGDTREISRCYEIGCCIYITKPVNYQQFCDAIHKLGLFLSVVSVPEGSIRYAHI
ncbi:MAG: response regulator [Candidatus Cloacimonadota bacterium]|nr:MAG: response regulator [Candidatus Cloacimonadota bacterium]